MKVLLDTNIVLRFIHAADPKHAQVVSEVESRADANQELLIAPQVLFELWTVLTRPPEVNGVGLKPNEARVEFDRIIATLPILPDPPDLLPRWLDLCTTRNVSGRPAHDARLVAWMLAHEVTQLLTLNPADFARYPEIHAVTPA